MNTPLLSLPQGLRRATAGYAWTDVTSGYSGALVYRLDAPGAETLFLKTGPPELRDELRDEAERSAWLAERVSAPRVLAFEEAGGVAYLLTSSVPGVDATDPSLWGDRGALVRLLAEGLRAFHAIPAGDCPFDHRNDAMIARARERVERGLVDADEFDDERQGQSAVELLDTLLATRPATEDLVVCHGDYCLPNVMIQGGRVSGFIDLGRAGVSDRYRDLGIGARSVAYNLGDEWTEPFLLAYGVGAPDWEKVRWYQLLDEFF